MSKIAKDPVIIEPQVEVSLSGNSISVKGPKATLHKQLNKAVIIKQEDGKLIFTYDTKYSDGVAQAGTARSLVNSMVIGVLNGFEKKLELVGVGYRAQVQGDKINLTLGFSHPVVYKLPQGITAETPSQTEIVLKGADKQVLGQVAAEIRAYRKPEPYKGKGVKYADEQIIRKEAKKK